MICLSCVIVTVTNCKFSELVATEGAAVYLSTTAQSPSQVSFQSCVFTNLTSEGTGAVVLESVNGLFHTCHFLDCQAVGSTPNNQGHGGALALLCSAMTEGCTVKVSFCEFVDNKAYSQGGSIYWKDSMPEISNCSFSGGRAQYGPDIASFPVQLVISSISGKNAENTNLALNNVASGQLSDQILTLALLDHYGQIVSINTDSALSLSSTSSSTSVLGATSFTVRNGTYTVQGFGVTAPPASSTTLLMRTSAIDYTKQIKARDNRTYSDTMNVAVHMRSCQIGESHQADQCMICPIGKYSLDPDVSCKECPTGATCYGNFTVVPQSGYWRSDMYSSTFWQCPYAPACLGSPSPPQALSFTGQCLEGYFGNLCNGCQSGFSRLNIAECGRCPSFIVNTIRTIGIILAVLIFLIVVVWSTIRSAYRARSHLSIYIKIFLNYLQLVMITATFSLDWPEQVKTLLEAQQTAGSAADQIFSIDCFLSTSKEDDQANAVRLKLLFLAFLPPFILLFCLVIWLPVAICQRKPSYLKNEMVASSVVCFFLVHPSLVRYQFGYLNCKELENGSFWLSSFLNIRCWDSSHLRYVLTVDIPSIVLWAVGLPAICLLYLHRNRGKLALIFMKIRLGFIYNGYNSDKYYWEFIIIYRKILIISISVFFTSVSTYIQALTVLIVIIIAMRLQSKHQPFSLPAMNNLELRGILVGGITIYCGLYSLTQGLDLASQVVLLIVIILANAYFLMYWMYKVIATSWRMLMSRCKWLRRLFGGYYKVEPTPSSVQASNLDDSKSNKRVSVSWQEDGDNSRVHLGPPQNSVVNCEPSSPQFVQPFSFSLPRS